MNKPVVIAVEWATRENMKDASTRRQTYDDLINELLKLKQKKEMKNRNDEYEY
jgi:hypothetical protein